MTIRRLDLCTPEQTAAAVTGRPPTAPFDDRRAQLAVYRVMAHNPALLDAWLPLCDYFLTTPGLDPRDREILILRSGVNCGSSYEWDKHAPKAPDVGISSTELEAIAAPIPDRATLDPWLVTLLDFADQLHRESDVSDDVWSAVRDRLGDAMAFTCLMLVGQYHMLAYALNGAGISEDPLPPTPEDSP